MSEPHSADRIPSADSLRVLCADLDTILSQTGPNEPPGLEMDFLAGEQWATNVNFNIQFALESLNAGLTLDFSGITRGWPGAVMGALIRVRAVTSRLMSEWVLTPYADLPPYPTGCGGKAGNVPVDFPLTLTVEDHRALRWAFEVLMTAISSVPREQRQAPPRDSRLIVRRDPPSVSLDGVPYGVTLEQAAFLDILNRNQGHLVEPAVFDRDPILRECPRRDRIKDRLPAPLRGLITAKRGGGFTMTLPPSA